MKRVQVEAAGIPLIDPVLAQQIMAFFKGLAGPGMIPSNQVPVNPKVSKTVPMTVKVVGNYSFLHPLLGYGMSNNENDMLNKFQNLKPSIFLGFDTEDAYEFILVVYDRFHKLGIVHQTWG